MTGTSRIAACLAMFALASLAGCSTDPTAGPQVAKADFDDPEREKTMIVILGASYAQGWNPTCGAQLAFLNRGAPGEQSFEMLARFEADVIPHQPRAVLLWGYINDIFRNQEPARDAAKQRARDSYVEMIRLAREHGIEPVLSTEVTIGPKAGFKEALAGFVGSILGKSSYQDRINGHVTELNRWLRNLAAAEGLLLLDFEKVLAGPDGGRKKQFCKEDGSHIAASGYEALDRYACEILAAHFRGSPKPATGE